MIYIIHTPIVRYVTHNIINISSAKFWNAYNKTVKSRN